MRVPDALLKCVGFVCEAIHGEGEDLYGDRHGTGFFVSIPFEDPHFVTSRFYYFVTAKHVAQELANSPIFFLVNSKKGAVIHMEEVYDSHWWHHPDPSVDVAVVLVGRQREADIIPVGIGQFATQERMESLDIGIGDEVFCTGLFSFAPGVGKNMPVVRTGNIAMLPEEQLQTENGFADVYFVESRSIGGLSGSPVFARRTVRTGSVKRDDGTLSPVFGNGPGDTLLGMMQGHWDIRESDMNKGGWVDHDPKKGVNMGFGIVVPAIKIKEVLYREELVQQRKELEKAKLRSIMPTMDSVKRKAVEEPDEAPFAQQDFDAALRKVSRKIEQ